MSVLSVAEQSGADALPIASLHGERFASLFEPLAIRAVVELVLIVLSVDADAEVHLCKLASTDDVVLTAYLDEYAVST